MVCNKRRDPTLWDDHFEKQEHKEGPVKQLERDKLKKHLHQSSSRNIVKKAKTKFGKSRKQCFGTIQNYKDKV